MLAKSLIFVFALSSAAVAAPTAAQKAQARKDWADISKRAPTQVKFLCKGYLPRKTVTGTNTVYKTSTTGTATATITGAPTTRTVSSGSTTETVTTTTTEVETYYDPVFFTETTTETETQPAETVTVTSTQCPDTGGVSKRTAIPELLNRRAAGEAVDVVFNRIKANDPTYLNTVCAQVQTGRYSTTVQPTVTRSVAATTTKTSHPTVLTTVPARTIKQTETETETSTYEIVVSTTYTETATESVTPTVTACVPEETNLCSGKTGFDCDGDNSLTYVDIPGQGRASGICWTGVDNTAFCGVSQAGCNIPCGDNNSCQAGYECALETCCGNPVCIRSCL